MVYRTITPLTDRAGAKVVGLGFTQPIGAKRRANFSRTSLNVMRRLCAGRPAVSDRIYKDHPTKKTGVAKGGRHGKQHLEAD
jgi:hypothetical protein